MCCASLRCAALRCVALRCAGLDCAALAEVGNNEKVAVQTRRFATLRCVLVGVLRCVDGKLHEAPTCKSQFGNKSYRLT